MENNLENNRLHGIISRLSHYISNIDSKKQRNASINKESFCYIPFCFLRFTKILDFLKSNITKDQPSFIDYGCGIGITVDYASALGFIASGIEYNADFKSYLTIIADLKEYRFAEESYDVVYFYSPFKEAKQEIPFEINALNSVKVGGYVIAPHPGHAYNLLLHKGATYRDYDYSKIKKVLSNFELLDKKVDFYCPIIQRIK